MSQLSQLILSGIVMGSIYALIAVGFVTIFNVTRIINFAQGEFVMVGAMVAVTLQRANLPLAPSFFLAVAAGTLVGLGLERLAIRPARGASILTLIIITIGASIALRGIALLLWGTDPFVLPYFSQGAPVSLLGARIVVQGFWVLGVTFLVMVGLHLFFEYTVTGKALKACSVNPSVAGLMGIRVESMAALSFGLSAGLGAVAGVVIAPITYATYDMGTMLALKGFVAGVMGGLTNTLAAVAAGFLLGILESLGAGLIHSGFKDASAFIILLVVLLLRPAGLLSLKLKEAYSEHGR